MKKFLNTDTLILVALFGVMLAWGPVYQKFFAPPKSALPPPVAATNHVTEASAPSTNAVVAETPEAKRPAAPAELRQSVKPPRAPETVLELTNGLMRLTVSSHGGCITSAELPAFQVTQKDRSPVILDFGKIPALAYEGLEGFDRNSDFQVGLVSNGVAVRMTATASSGIRLVRTIGFGQRYEVMVDDTFLNPGLTPVALPGHSLSLGGMEMLPGETRMSGVNFLGIDTLLSAGDEGVKHWAGSPLANFFQEEPRRGGCVGRPPQTKMMPESVREKLAGDVAWAAVKNKFFVQILEPKGGAAGCELMADRVRAPGETAEDRGTWAAAAEPSRVAATVRFSDRTLAPGERAHRVSSYYVGPKEMTSLIPLGLHKKHVMDFGWFRWVCEVLLWSLDHLYQLIPNYGVAIILLTLIVRIIFWPLTHKGTESMKRMQALQPQIKELQAKFRDKPQKLHQETMALYKENKVNPLGGCLPMLIQIPVFFALFSVLRSAVELRYAPFLWVHDLSAPENLFQGMIPVVGSLNLLPLLMTVTQIWQMKLTPSGGDPMQQKMMMWMMPIMMLVFLYSMPSALVLYWTANQCAMIVQLLWQRSMKK